jgi:hypothetical protein
LTASGPLKNFVQQVDNAMPPVYSRKQFLDKFLAEAVRVIAAVAGDASADGPGPALAQRSAPAGGELCPSLVRLEAERLGLDAAGADPDALRRILYDALERRCEAVDVDDGGQPGAKPIDS